MESKKTSQTRKNRRRSSRNVIINGENEDTKERSGKRLRDSKDSENEGNQDIDVYKDILDLVPADHLNCAPSEFPAPPGTRVNLHGVILHETQGGLIVLNVRWRNKVFSGALIDAEKNKWASDQIKDPHCYDKNFQAPPPIKKLKIPTSTAAQSVSIEDNDTKKKTITSPTTPSKTSKPSRSTSKKRNSQEITSPLPQEESSASKKTKTKANETFVCPDPNCSRKYKNKNGLTNHIKNVHENSQKNGLFEEKSDESDSGEDQFVIDEESKDDVNESKVDPSHEPNENSDEGSDEKKEEPTETTEKQIERLKLSTEKALLYIKKEKEPSEMESVDRRDSVKEENDVKTGPENENCADAVQTQEELATETQPVRSTDMKIIPEEAEEKMEIEVPSKPPVSIPIVQIDPVPASNSSAKEEKCPDVVVSPAVKTEDEHPKGSSKTIIHEDHVTSLNELFAPAQNYHQYSPTLSHLNPQTINDSLKEAKKSLGKENANSSQVAKTENKEVVKTQLVQKPSVEIKHVEEAVDAFENKVQVMKTYEMVNRVPNTAAEIVECSEDERSISPENMLNDCHKTYPQVERDVKVSMANNLMCMTMASSNLFMNPVVQSVLTQPSKAFENSLINKELAGKLSTTALSINSLQPKLAPNTLPFSDFVPYDSKNIPQLVSYFSPNSNFLQSTDMKSGPSVPPFENGLEQKTGSAIEMGPVDSQAKPSLLKQRLLAPPVKSESGLLPSPPGSQLFLQSSVSSTQMPRQGDGGIELPIPEKKTPSTFTINRDRVNDKPKVQPNSLRINPPITTEERTVPATRTWYPPDVKNMPPSSQQPPLMSKEYYNNQTVSTAPYRISVTKSPTNLHVYNTNPNFNKSSKVSKRPTHLIPIAPAPTTILSVPTSIVCRNDVVSNEHTSPESDKEQPQMSRFTLTSDNRMIQTPPENRGRPRKIRVEKTHQVPKGTAQELARTRGPADSPVMRKHPPSPVVRASVIQGSVHGSMEGTQALAKSNDRSLSDDHLLLQHHTRCFDGSAADERDRYAMLANTPAELRSNPEKYKDFSGIFQGMQGMYRSTRTGRSGILSPPSSSIVTSSMDSMPPVITHESFSQYQMVLESLKAPNADHRNFIDIHRGKSDISRVVTPDQLRPTDSSRKTPLSPPETLSIPNYVVRAEMAEKERRLNEFHSPVSRYQHPPGLRPDYPVIRSENRALYDPRGSVEDKEHEKKLRMQHDRFLPTPPIMHHGNPPSSSQAHHSNNLVLGRADGAIIGPLSSYDYRNSEQKR